MIWWIRFSANSVWENNPQIPVCRGDVSELSGKPDAGIQNEHIPWKTRFRSVVCIAVLNSCIKSFLWYASISRKPLIHSLSTDGHKGSFIGIMFVLHSCCVSAAFTTTSETVYWYNASIPAWLMPSAQIRMSRIYVVDSKFTKYLPPWCILLLHDVSVATISETASGVAKNPVRFHYIQCLRKRRWISHSVPIK